MKFLFSLFFFFWVNISFSQLDVHEYYVENNKDFVFDSIIFSEKGHFIFFCPSYYGKQEYDQASSSLKSDLEQNNVSGDLVFVFFNCENDRPKSGLPVSYLNESNLSYVYEFDLVFYKPNNKRYIRAKQLLKEKFITKKAYGLNDFEFINFNFVCVNAVTYQIPTFAEFISETYNPKYSVNERIQHLTDSLFNANRAIDDLNSKMLDLNLENDSLVSRLDRIEYFVDSFHRESIQSIEGEEYAEYSGDYVPPLIEPKRRPKDAIMTIGAILMSFFTMSFIVFS